MTKSVEFPQCAHFLEVNYCLEVLIAHLRNIALLSGYGMKRNFKQECIPVGYVPPAAVAVRGVSTRHPPGPDSLQQVTPEAGTPPGPDPPGTRHPLGPGTPPDQAPPQDQTPPLGPGPLPLWTDTHL